MNATCLCFSDNAGVAEFLNSGGNSALLDGPLLQVGGLHVPGDEGGRMSVCAVLVGLARLLRDYRGVRKHPNVLVRVHPEVGPNDGFVKIMVRTHNGCGIAAGSEIVADFGEGYVPSTVPVTPAAKRFRGALDLFFEKKVEDLDEGAPQSQETDDDTKKTGLANMGSSPGKAGSSPAPGPSGASMGSSPGGTGSTPGGQGSTLPPSGSGSASGAGGSTGGASGSAGASAGGGGASGSAGGSGALEGLKATKTDVQVVVDKAGVLVARTEVGKKGVVKIPPKTVVATYNAGAVVEVKDASAKDFAFTKGKQLVVNATDLTVTTLADIIKKNHITQLFAHASFAKGVCPPVLAVKKKMGFVPKDATSFKPIQQVGTASGKCQLLWVVQIKEDKIVPKTLAVVTMKQVIVKDSEEAL